MQKRARRTTHNVWYREKQEIICFQIIIYLRIDHFPLTYDLRGKCNIKQSCVHSTLKSTYISVCGMAKRRNNFLKSKNIAQYKNTYKQYIYDGHIAI